MLRRQNEGRLQSRRVRDAGGGTRSWVEIRVDHVQFLERDATATDGDPEAREGGLDSRRDPEQPEEGELFPEPEPGEESS